MAADSSGQMLLTRLCLLPPELVDKIAQAAELPHDFCEAPANRAEIGDRGQI